MMYPRFSVAKAGGLAVLALALGVAGQAVAQVYTLTDLNSIARIDPYSQRGMFDWSVEGQNQLYQQWFWYRVGNTGPEASINNISAPVVTTIDSRSISLAYSAQTYSVEINYLLTGGAVGSRVSDILETIRIRNLGTSPLDMHFFQYSDFNLQGSAGNDVVGLGRNLRQLFNEAWQHDAGLPAGQGVAKHRALGHGLSTEAQTKQQAEQAAHQPGGQFS